MGKILVIDDDEAFRTTLATMLEKQGFEVLQAATGGQGVQLARTDFPNLILCDVELGGVGGNLVLYAVRRDPQLASIPFVLMSGFAISEDTPSGIKKGADGFLVKPFSQMKLTATIFECMNKGQATGEEVSPRAKFSAGNTECSRTEVLDSLKRLVEATGIISTAYERLDSSEIAGLATEAHQAASHLYQTVDNWLPAQEFNV